MAPVKKAARPAASATMSPPGVGGPIDVAFSFDTTGSMYGCLAEVRNKIQDIIQKLFGDIPQLRISVVAHGDYCDAATYVTKMVDFTDDVTKLCQFVQKVKGTHGGDYPECYELVLRQARELLSWRPGSQRVLVMVGDAIPHEATEAQNKDNIDWKEEVQRLRDEGGVRIYGIQANENASAGDFWKALADMTGGKHLGLKAMESIVEILMGICYREHDPEVYLAYEREVRARKGAAMGHELDRMLVTLRGGEDAAGGSAPAGAGVMTPPASPRRVALKAPAARKRGGASVKGGRRAKSRRHSDVSDGDDTDSVTSDGELRSRKTTSLKRRKTATSTAARRSLRKAVKMTRADNEPRYSLGKRHRETVDPSDFLLKDLPWSDWQLAMTVYRGVTPDNPAWKPCRGGEANVGVRDTSLFQWLADPEAAAVYEVAVQPGWRLRRYPVYLRMAAATAARRRGGHWDSQLFGHPAVADQAQAALRRGCQVFVRRAELQLPIAAGGHTIREVNQLRKLVRDTYDYAWSSRTADGSQRRVVRSRIALSGY